MELDTLDLNWCDEEVRDAGSRTLVGKIMTKRNLNRNTVRSMILKGWNLKGEVKIVESENGCFLFSFEDVSECARILRDRPWLIMGFLMIVQERRQFEPISEVLWKFCPYWVQIHGIPIEGFTEENILRIGARIGVVEEYERPIVNGVVMRSFLRIRVLVDVSKSLVDGFWISRPGLGRCWIQVKYEKLQVFCHKCGVINHDARDCGSEKIMSAVNPSEPRYGSWIGTLPCRVLGELVFVESEKEDESDRRDAMQDDVCPQEVCGNYNNSVAASESVSTVKSDVNCDAVGGSDSGNCWKNDANSDRCALVEINKNMNVDCSLEKGKNVVMVEESSSTDVVRRGLRRKRVVNFRDIKALARSSVFGNTKNVLNCYNEDYIVEFPSDEDGESMKRRLSLGGQGELVESLRAVSLCREVEGRQGKKVKASVEKSAVVNFDNGSGYDSLKKQSASKEKRCSVLEEVKSGMKEFLKIFLMYLTLLVLI